MSRKEKPAEGDEWEELEYEEAWEYRNGSYVEIEGELHIKKEDGN